ncbi:MAG: hypothetical protein KJ077_46130 [Anaerolineae bacterium]|nr:hypothetical protein [Anaerolineae bacterium]
MFEKLKSHFSRAWHWTLAQLPFGRKGVRNPVIGVMDEVEQRYQAFQRRQRIKRLKRRATQIWSRFQQRVSGIFAPGRAWIKTHQRALTLMAVGLGVALLGVAGLLLWRRSPAFRAAMATALATAAALVATARATRPVTIPTSDVVIETVEPMLEMA